MAKKKAKRTFHYRTEDPRYELIARRMYDHLPVKKQSIQSELDRELFQDGWEKEHEERRAKHRAAGLADTKFYHPRQLKAMGYRYNYGRRRKIVAPAKPKTSDTPTPVVGVD